MPPIEIAMLDAVETVTTVPLTVEATNAGDFWELVLEGMPARRNADPAWAVALVILGALLFIGAGAFLITIGYQAL